MNEPADRPNEPKRRRWGRTPASPPTPPDLRNAALVTDSRVEIEIDPETGAPHLRIVSGARTKHDS